ncbi:alpha/beta hydrolase [Bradyrhizobium sp. 170]|uniref:alpha/beta hydrolase family protein n=1 Tax=Bradyrhizobium sp. 170 TaxID=2782641 RepID=UPI001FFFD515|nr:alpha/beta hydrolase [Bradyrhizobium sp. 170]UPK05805.1 alpha/beta hydrolase [Bradyrhizobium sp. 170]
MFLEYPPVKDTYEPKGAQNWVARWIKNGDAHCFLGDSIIKKGACNEAAEAWLCALTAFEVARRLVDEDDRQNGDISAKIEAAVQRFALAPDQRVARVQIACGDQTQFSGHYLPAGHPDSRCAAVICISREQETGAMLLGRLLPTVFARGMSILVVSYEDVSNHSPVRWEVLSCCLDFLSARREVDASRIGIYGEGLSAILATDFAASDRRLAAAVCDGGLWNWVRTLASVAWMTKAADVVDQDILSARRSHLIRQLRCPVLVVAGGRSIVSASEAIELQADCRAAHMDVELAIPRMVRTPGGEIENFVTSDDCIFGWLAQKLGRTSAP